MSTRLAPLAALAVLRSSAQDWDKADKAQLKADRRAEKSAAKEVAKADKAEMKREARLAKEDVRFEKSDYREAKAARKLEKLEKGAVKLP